MQKKFIILIIILFASCDINQRPHFVNVDNNYLKKFDFSKDYIDTLVTTKNYDLYYIGKTHEWDTDHYYFLKNKAGLAMLEPSNEITNGFTALELVNDSTLVFYTQFYDRIFGDSWVIKKGKSVDVKLDPGTISNTTTNDLVYHKGKLKQIGDIKVDIDSLRMKNLKNKLFRLSNNELKEVGDYKNLKGDIVNLPDGVYYFSYPGRHISDTLHLK